MRKSLYLLVALVCGTVAAVLASQWLKAQANSQGTADTAEIFIAAVAIDVGEAISPEKIRLEQWPSDKVPQGATGDLTLLEGKYASQRFYAGEAVMPVKLMDENWTTVPKGFRVVAMKAADVGIANLVQPGDRVDVMAYFQKSDVIPRSMTKTVLTGVRVYALDGDKERRPAEERPKTLRNISLLIHEEDAEAWTYANELGTVRLSLGSEADNSAQTGSNAAAQEFLAWLEEYRQAQEATQRKQEQDKLQAMTAPRAQPAAAPAAPVPQQPAEEGFSMVKIVGGQMKEYWIVPGKLPVLIGEVGGDTSTAVANPASSNSVPDAQPAPAAGGTDSSNDYRYLNGEDSPLFQSPSNNNGGLETDF